MGIVHCSCVQKEAESNDSGPSPGVTTAHDDALCARGRDVDQGASGESPDNVPRRESDATLPATLYADTNTEHATEEAECWTEPENVQDMEAREEAEVAQPNPVQDDAGAPA